MSERKQNLSVAWSVWLDAATTALTRAREDRLGCRIDVPARGGDAVCELLDGAEVIGRYVAMGVQPALPLGEAKAEPSRGRVRYGFRPADLAMLTDDELATLDGWFPGGFVKVHLPRTDPAVWWHTQYTEPSATSRAFLEWSATHLRAGVPVTGVNAEEQRAIDAAREDAFAASVRGVANLVFRPSAPTGFHHETAAKPQEPAPVETATSGGYQAEADAASRAPVGDPASALNELLAAAEGTLIPHAQGPVTVRSLRPVADLRAEEQAPAITEQLKRKLARADEAALDCAVCHTAAPTELKVGVTVFVYFVGARFPEAYTVRALADTAELAAPDVTQPGGRTLPPTLRVPREAVRWTATEGGDGGRWELPVVTLRDDGGPTHYRYGLLASTLAGLSAEALDELDRIHPTGYVWVDLNGKGSPAWWMNAAHDAPVAKEKPARTKRPNLATPPPEADAQRAEEFASIVQEGFVRPVIAREAWEKLTDEARGAFAVFRLGSGSHVRTSWGPTKDGKGVEPLLPPIGRRSEIALNLEEIAAELGVTLTFEPHPVMGIPAPDAPSSSGAPDDAPAAPAKLHRQTPEPAADKRAGRGRHTILAQDASGAWTFKRERHGETGPAWRDVATNLAASGKRVRVYDGKPRCTWDSLDEPVPQFVLALAELAAVPPDGGPALGARATKGGAA